MLSPVQDEKLCQGLLLDLCGPQEYCPRSLRGQVCNGVVCGGLKHIQICGVVSPGVLSSALLRAAENPRKKSEVDEQAFCCAICQDVFAEPVTLSCGHTFDRHCLSEHFCKRDASCPLCRTPVTGPLPSMNFTVRDLVLAAYPARVSAREAELAARPVEVKTEGTPVATAENLHWRVSPAVAVIVAALAARVWPFMWQLGQEVWALSFRG